MSVKKPISKNIVKTIRGKPSESSSSTRQLSSTMEIPVEAVFEGIATESVAYLDINCPGQDLKRIPLTKNDTVIGREDECHIRLPFANVSRKHAHITRRDEEHIIEDLDSTNGTYVNGIRISRCILRNDDRIRIGDAKIAFVRQKIQEKS